MPSSQNGYSAPITPVSYDLPGGRVSLRAGAAGQLLAWLARQFNERVEPLAWPGVWGYNYREIRGGVGLSNHSSGTAIDLNAPAHPQGTNPSANFTPAKIAAIRGILAQTEGCVRWGGDYTPPALKDGMHFEIIQNETRCAQVLAKLTQQGDDVTPQDIQAIATAVLSGVVPNKSNGNPDPLRENLGWTLRGVDVANAKLDALTTAVAGLAAHPDITPEELAAMIDDSIAKHVQITGTVEIGSKP